MALASNLAGHSSWLWLKLGFFWAKIMWILAEAKSHRPSFFCYDSSFFCHHSCLFHCHSCLFHYTVIPYLSSVTFCKCLTLQVPCFFWPLFVTSAMSSQPIHKIQPTAKLTSENAGELILALHCRAIVSDSVAAAPPPLSPVSEHLGSSPPTDFVSSSPDPSPCTSAKRAHGLVLGKSSQIDNDTRTTASQEDSRKSKKPKMTPAPGQLAMRLQHNTSIIEINDTNDPQTEQLKKTDASADIKEFFTPMPRVPGQEKAHMLCKLCK